MPARSGSESPVRYCRTCRTCYGHGDQRRSAPPNCGRRRRKRRGSWYRVLPPWPRGPRRSEEHTSELQSQSNLVCRLLLEKKKQNNGVSVTATSPKLHRANPLVTSETVDSILPLLNTLTYYYVVKPTDL